MQRQKLYARRIARSFKRVLRRILDIIRLYPPVDDLETVGRGGAMIDPGHAQPTSPGDRRGRGAPGALRPPPR